MPLFWETNPVIETSDQKGNLSLFKALFLF